MVERLRIKVLITVKTYPSLSVKYDELVCTAGFRENGEWIRLYPIPFRKLNQEAQYSKYQWIELDVVKNTSDFRKESYKPIEPDKISIGDEIKPDGKDWHKRREICLKKVYNDLESLILEAKNEHILTSLATFKPSKLIDFKVKRVIDDWDQDKLNQLIAERRQLNLFEEKLQPIDIVNKLPYKFSYTFEDIKGKQSTLMIEDWEIGALYWKSFQNSHDEAKAVEDVRKKYWDEFTKRDIYLFLGTTKEHHLKSRNPFIIIGVFYPSHTPPSLF